MSVAIALTVGALFAMGTFLLLRDDLVKIVLGLSVLSQAVNIYLITMGGLAEGTFDLVPILDAHGHETPAVTTADPLVQALVLTAIVISFGMTAFTLVLSYRAYQENETMNVTEWKRGGEGK